MDGCVPSRFSWSVPSPRKRKAPTERLPLPIPLSLHKSKKHSFTSDTASEIIAFSAVESSNEIFSLDRFKSDSDFNFYTGLPKHATLICIFEFLNPGENCESIRSRISSDAPQEFTTLNLTTRKMPFEG